MLREHSFEKEKQPEDRRLNNHDFGVTKQYITYQGKPWFPVMGEMHYSRYREDLWEESLYKMKAAGVEIVSSYVIWIHHEEIEGEFDFSGCRDLRRFLECCKKVGIKMFLRIGPWVHGECRNGGFPDWLIKKEDMELRSDDAGYLRYVERYWEQIWQQAKDFLYKDGGPVIGLQIENEYGHVGGFNGEKGEQHMRTLKQMAERIGFDVPLYTATGWGGAVIGDCLPVMGGYCEAPWDQSTGELSANTNYVFSHERNDALIACDHHVEDAVTFDESSFPYLTAELGGGLQVTAHRRPVATGPDIGAMSLVKVGSGATLLGYYMYHGGSNPEGKCSTLQESKETGYANDLPEINYDFNAPIRQYGTISDSLKEIKLLAYFMKDFGEDMAALPAEIERDHINPEDTKTLRTTCRHDDTHGYVFFNNYQRRRTMEAHKNVVLEGKCASENIKFPAIDLENGEYGFFPYHMKLGKATLRRALATPLCRLKNGEEESFVFYGDREPAYEWENGVQAKVIHLSREDALRAWRVKGTKEYLILSDDYVWEQDGEIHLVCQKGQKIRTYPALEKVPEMLSEAGCEGIFHIYEYCERKEEITCKLTEKKKLQAENGREEGEYTMTLRYPQKLSRTEGEDILLSMSYDGNGMELFVRGKKVNDYFYTGQKAVFSLGYFDFPEEIVARVQALEESEQVFLEKLPMFERGTACRLQEVEVIRTQEVVVK